MEYSIYINKEDAAQAEEDELNDFIRGVLVSMELDLDNIWEEDAKLDVEAKIKLRKLLGTYDIDIIHDGDRGYEIYVGDEIIAEWLKPRTVLRKDPQARRASRRTFYEMMITCSSIFEDDEEEGK